VEVVLGGRERRSQLVGQHRELAQLDEHLLVLLAAAPDRPSRLRSSNVHGMDGSMNRLNFTVRP
jgi:hypothetical protein